MDQQRPNQYINASPLDGRRDSQSYRPNSSIQAFTQRRDTFIDTFDTTTVKQYPEMMPEVRTEGPSRSQSSSTLVNMGKSAETTRSNSFSDLNKIEESDPRQSKHEMDIRERDLEIGGEPDHHRHTPTPDTLTLRQRLKHFTFAWYASTMSTGGVAFVLSVLPNRFEGMTGLGTFVFVFNIMLFISITITMICRFVIHPGTFTHALANPHEGFFMATFWLSFATMITNTTAYGIPNTGPWLLVALRIAFWVYTVCATLVAIFYYHVIFTVKKLEITNVLPGWVLPIFPAMLVGTLASAIAKTQPADSAAAMLVTGLTYQGLGMIMAIGMYGIYFGRLMTAGLPADASRPAMFIALGPPSFTALAFIGMAQDTVATKIFTEYLTLPGINDPAAITDMLQLLALLCAIFLWMLSFWFFAIALVATIEALPRNDFHLNWYAYVFPNVGFTISTIKIGERLNSAAIMNVGNGMGVVLFFVWATIVICHIRALRNKKICWPGKDEDAH